ncbi:selenocysteine-specific elongation factor [Georgenia satyanarayanai]|uniref:Selenocysteine-specific elongation factor n=1 Tax=Georgenia satyanarayanai TaxID=860221 RepID=A0A2Y9AJG5_9MICO|nr:SelB C-terminal domain-containing protein [Georgenia satyanarayanai]PYF99582.1 selenocysteine-specific elongation factor [Georgenia satyanarayanai]SSA42427.1 selenocysteine-specific elongation factor [Georgenia satyanarayanai]
MHVVATAGHVDHGKSALVTALTGAQPDRLEEEQRRGLSIELGYAWTTLPGAGEVAFVDVPGHERFISTTLAGLGPVPAVLFVVAADDPWMPQATEHLAALDALGVEHGVLAVTRADLADPDPARERALAELATTSLRGAPAVTVSARTGEGVEELRAALATMLSALARPPAQEPVRLWVDRSFSMPGAGTVVTGTLPAGRVRPGDGLASSRGGHRVRAVQSLGRPVEEAQGPARVALNVSGRVERGAVLVAPGAWHHTEVVDVRLGEVRLGTGEPPQRPLLHLGSTVLSVHHRPLGPGLARLTAERPLPLRVGDRALLRDPGTRRLWAVTVLDPAPPPLQRRGAARLRADALAAAHGQADVAAEVARRGVVAVELLARIGVPVGAVPTGAVAAGGWLLSAERAAAAARAALEVVTEHASAAPLEPPLTVAALAERLGLPTTELAAAVVGDPLRLEAGRVRLVGDDDVPADVRAAVSALHERLDGSPFAAPSADELPALGLSPKVQGAAVRAGLLLCPAPGVVLLAGADDLAAARLGELAQPFTVSDARGHLATSRRVVLPLLAHLDRTGRTRRLPDDRRRVTGR